VFTSVVPDQGFTEADTATCRITAARDVHLHERILYAPIEGALIDPLPRADRKTANVGEKSPTLRC